MIRSRLRVRVGNSGLRQRASRLCLDHSGIAAAKPGFQRYQRSQRWQPFPRVCAGIPGYGNRQRLSGPVCGRPTGPHALARRPAAGADRQPRRRRQMLGRQAFSRRRFSSSPVSFTRANSGVLRMIRAQ